MQVTVFRTENKLLGTLITQQLLFMRFFLHDVFGMGEVWCTCAWVLFYSQLVVRHIPKLRSKNSEELDYEIILPSRNETSFATATRTSERRSAWKFARADEAKITALVISRLRLSLHYYVWCVEARFELLPRAKNASVKRSIYNPVQSR